jgi:hypothetical protein
VRDGEKTTMLDDWDSSDEVLDANSKPVKERPKCVVCNHVAKAKATLGNGSVIYLCAECALERGGTPKQRAASRKASADSDHMYQALPKDTSTYNAQRPTSTAVSAHIAHERRFNELAGQTATAAWLAA